MHKRLFMLAALLALFALSTLAGHAFAAVEYRYEPTPNLACNGTPNKESMRGSLVNQSGQTITVQPWYQLVGGSKQPVGSSFSLFNNTEHDVSYIKTWPQDLQAIGWDVTQSVSGVSIANTGDSCVY